MEKSEKSRKNQKEKKGRWRLGSEGHDEKKNEKSMLFFALNSCFDSELNSISN